MYLNYNQYGNLYQSILAAPYRNYYFRYLLATLRANEVKMVIILVKKSFDKMTFGPLLVGEVVTTINNPMIAKAIDAQMNTFVAIFCIILINYFNFYTLRYLLAGTPTLCRLPRVLRTELPLPSHS